MSKILNMCCSVCGNGCKGRQWWNRDKGFSICLFCALDTAKSNTPESMRRMYGEKGMHYDVDKNPRITRGEVERLQRYGWTFQEWLQGHKAVMRWDATGEVKTFTVEDE